MLLKVITGSNQLLMLHLKELMKRRLFCSKQAPFTIFLFFFSNLTNCLLVQIFHLNADLRHSCFLVLWFNGELVVTSEYLCGNIQTRILMFVSYISTPISIWLALLIWEKPKSVCKSIHSIEKCCAARDSHKYVFLFEDARSSLFLAKKLLHLWTNHYNNECVAANFNSFFRLFDSKSTKLYERSANWQWKWVKLQNVMQSPNEDSKTLSIWVKMFFFCS